MKAIILAAGEGKRMHPLTKTRPKPLLNVCGKPLIEHLIDAIPPEVSELIVVVGYLGDQIKSFLGSNWRARPVTYVFQPVKLGTADALFLCKNFFEKGEQFLVLYADDLHSSETMANCVALGKPCLSVVAVDNPQKFGVVTTDEGGRITRIEEKPEKPASNLVSSGVLVLDGRIFDYPAPVSASGERYITDSIYAMIAEGHEFHAVHSRFWFPIATPQDLAKANTLRNAEA